MTAQTGTGIVDASINYQGEMEGRPAYYATDYSRDRLALVSEKVAIRDLRDRKGATSLDEEGFMLVDHRTAVRDFHNDDDVANIYIPEVERLMLEITGAQRILMNRRCVLRFSERSQEFGSRVNTRPARFVHVDFSSEALPMLLQPLLQAAGYNKPPGRRYIGFNVWRVISPPPQDIPLSVCDMRSVDLKDMVEADAIFDAPGQPEWGFEGYLFHPNPKHRWGYFSNMTRDEALIFKSFDSEAQPLQCVPHVAFSDPNCPPDAAPRASVEARGFAFFDD